MAKEYQLPFTAAEVESKLTKVDTLPTKEYVDGKIPTKLSEFENDSKFTTEEAIEELLEGVAAAAHASTHAKDGSDPLTPEAIGAEVAGSAATALSNAKTYVDNKISNLINGAPETMDTLKEVAEAISANGDIVNGLNSAIGNKANASDLTAHTNDTAIHFTAAERTKLSGIAENANKYTLPNATSSTLGGIKVGSNISVSSGTISLSKDNVVAALGYTPATGEKATTGDAGLMSSSDKAKLDAISDSADAVSFTADLHGGTKIGTLTINGENTSLYAPNNTDSKVNMTHSATTKAYLLGTLSTPSSTTTPVTAVADTNVYLDTSAGMLTATTFKGALSGTANKATTLATNRTIDGVSFNGGANVTHFGVCSTDAATVAKVVDCAYFTLETGARIIVQFANTNSASNPTLNVNGTGAKAIYYRGAAITAGHLAAGRVYEFVYDGTNYEFVGDIDTNTTYNTPVAISTSSGGASAKSAVMTKYNLTGNRYFMIMFASQNTAATAVTLNVAGAGAKPLYLNGEATSASNYSFPAGVYVVYYDGTNYHIRTDNIIPGVVQTANALSSTLTVEQGGTGATTFTSGAALIGAGTGAVTTRTIMNNTATSSTITANTNLITANTLRYAINRTSSVAAANTSYTTLMARGISLYTSATAPSVNGAITFTYA